MARHVARNLLYTVTLMAFSEEQRLYILKYAGHPKAVRLVCTAAEMRAKTERGRIAHARSAAAKGRAVMRQRRRAA